MVPAADLADGSEQACRYPVPERTRGHGGGQAADRRCDGSPDRCGIANRDGAGASPGSARARRAARASRPSSRSASRAGKADVRQAPHRQSGRDRLPRHPHGAAPGHPHGRGLFRGRCPCLHAALADEAVAIGPPPARESYLRGEKIIAAAMATGAEAIHPGYGFLSENADFAEACAAAGLVFIGPPAAAMRAMGSKSEAKALMEKAGVPVVPGYHGADQDDGALAAAAKRIGYPVLIKASAGGGGKGMRRVDKPGEFAEALASARREAKAAFGDDRMLVEKYLLRPAPCRGAGLRRQPGPCAASLRARLLDPAPPSEGDRGGPAPGLAADLTSRMGEAAIAAAAAVGYVGAGTIEFILDRSRRVLLHGDEHAASGRASRDRDDHRPRSRGVAAPRRLGRASAARPRTEVSAWGHAFEARIYAEDPARDFLPATGRLVHFALPEPDGHVRIDSGVRPGDEISIHYDPMMAKLIVWDEDRELARRRLVAALGQVEIVGLANNVAFLQGAGRPSGLCRRRGRYRLHRAPSRRSLRAGSTRSRTGVGSGGRKPPAGPGRKGAAGCGSLGRSLFALACHGWLASQSRCPAGFPLPSGGRRAGCGAA